MVGLLLATTAAAVVGCEPADRLSSRTVSAVTDQLATHALKSDGYKVQRLSCDASTGRKHISVDCVGRTDDEQKISVKGKVTEQLDDSCVRGHLTAMVGSRKVFDVSGLGDC